MSIFIKVAEKNRRCNVCESCEDVMNIFVGRTMHNGSRFGTEIALCRNCAKFLQFQLSHKLNREKEVEE